MRKYFKGILFFIITACSGSSMAWADISVLLEANRTEATLADTIKLTVTVKGANKTAAPTISGLEPFNVRSGGTSSRIQVLNSNVIREMGYTFFLTPQKTGSFVIGPARVVLKGKTYQSRTLHLTVKNIPSYSGKDRGPLFAAAALSSTTGYVGQEWIYTLKLYRNKEVSDISLIPPEIAGVTLKRSGDHKEYTASVQGQNYSVVELRYILNVDKPGSYAIPPALFKMNIIERRDPFAGRSPFDDNFFGFSRAKPVSIGSNPVELTVKPLPHEGRPEDFSGLVGKFTLNMALSPRKVKRGESATLTLMVNGRGNAHLIPDLKLPDVKNTKVYADQPVLDLETGFDGTTGTKTMKWALVPQQEGSVGIPPTSISFIDPDSGSYVKSTTDPAILEVVPGDTGPKISSPEEKIAITKPLKKEVQMEGLDIFAIHEGPDALRPDSLRQLQLWSFWLLLLFPPCGFMLAWGIKVFRSRNRELPGKGALSRFLKGMKGLPGERQLSYMAGITNAYLNERMGLSGGSLTSGEVYALLIQRGLEEKLAGDLKNILFELESQVYAGQENTKPDPLFRKNLVSLIKKIDRGIIR